ncbi:MAG: hypothetical protein KA160_05735 [Lacibacter sp.]|nr:hypothetical protein [Lacibacter sp.]
MKIQELLSQYLYKEKSLSLPGLGRFDLDPSVNIYDLKEEGWPANTISFTTNKNAVVSDELLQFLIKQTGKMKPLAMSDLESYVSNGLQLINIGKPFPIKGIGSINKTKDNQFTFEQGSPALEKIDSINTDHVRDRTVLAEGEREIDFSHEEPKSSKKPIIIFGSIVGLVLVGWAIYLAIPKKAKAPEPEANLIEQVTPVDTTALQQTDTTANIVKDSAAPVVTAPVVDTNSLTLILETVTTKSKADARIAFHKTRNREVTINIKDSSTYQLIFNVKKPLADSSKVKDSLRNWYGIKALVLKPGN